MTCKDQKTSDVNNDANFLTKHAKHTKVKYSRNLEKSYENPIITDRKNSKDVRQNCANCGRT